MAVRRDRCSTKFAEEQVGCDPRVLSECASELIRHRLDLPGRVGGQMGSNPTGNEHLRLDPIRVQARMNLLDDNAGECQRKRDGAIDEDAQRTALREELRRIQAVGQLRDQRDRSEGSQPVTRLERGSAACTVTVIGDDRWVSRLARERID